MRLSEEERAANRAAFRAMGPAQKADYIFSYYKLPLVLALIVIVAVGSVAYRALTHKEPLLHVAFANVVPPEEVNEALTSGFVREMGADPRSSEVACYRELYLSAEANTSDHQFAYASKLKVMAATEGHQLDVVLMNRESYDLLSASGFLLDLGSEFANDPHMQSNTVVLESNQVEVDLGEADTYEAKTVEVANALEVTQSPLLQGFSGDEAIYVGIVANTPRTDTALAYLRYVEGA